MAVLKGIFLVTKGPGTCVKANTEHQFVLVFDSPIESNDATLLRCQLYDEIFQIDYTFSDIPVSSLTSPTEEELKSTFIPIYESNKYIRILTMNFPERLAGGTFRMEIMVSKDPTSIEGWGNPIEIAKEDLEKRKNDKLKRYFNKELELLSRKILKKEVSEQTMPSEPLPRILFAQVEEGYFSVNITVKSAVEDAPKIGDIYFADDENIKFGMKTSVRGSATYKKNEIIITHIHTRGLYGANIYAVTAFRDKNKITSTIRVKDNTAIYIPSLSAPSGLFNIDIYIDMQISVVINRMSKKKISYTYDCNNFENKPISTTAVYTSLGGDVYPTESSETKCKVEFRPTLKYDGTFGFSWYRFGDMKVLEKTSSKIRNTRLGAKQVDSNGNPVYKNGKQVVNPYEFDRITDLNDQPFINIMGYHYEIVKGATGKSQKIIVQNGNKSSPHRDFKPDYQMSKNHRYDYHRIEMPNIYVADPSDSADPKKPENEYYIPWMTLCKDVEVELQLLMVIKEQPEKLIFNFDNPKVLSDGFMTINGKNSPLEILWPSVTLMNANNSIKIKCLKEFSRQLRLCVYAEVSDPKSTNKSITHLCGAVNILPNDISHQRKIKVVLFNIKTNINGSKLEGINANNSSKKDKEDVLRKFLRQAYITPQIEVVDLDLVDLNTNITDQGYTEFCDTNLSALDYDKCTREEKNGLINLSTYLQRKVRERYDRTYDKCFKIFFSPERFCADHKLTGTAGYSAGEKFTICVAWGGAHTSTHELLHSLGLPHTFDGSTSRAKYVYEDGMTDNLMDYCSFSGIKAKSLFLWQWQAINIKL